VIFLICFTSLKEFTIISQPKDIALKKEENTKDELI